MNPVAPSAMSPLTTVISAASLTLGLLVGVAAPTMLGTGSSEPQQAVEVHKAPEPRTFAPIVVDGRGEAFAMQLTDSAEVSRLLDRGLVATGAGVTLAATADKELAIRFGTRGDCGGYRSPIRTIADGVVFLGRRAEQPASAAARQLGCPEKSLVKHFVTNGFTVSRFERAHKTYYLVGNALEGIVFEPALRRQVDHTPLQGRLAPVVH